MVQTGTEKVLLVHVDLGNVREDQAEFIDQILNILLVKERPRK